MNILFVCHGNICRSVMAEVILRNLDEHNYFNVDSCATSYEEIGNDIYPPIKDVLLKHNYQVYPHKARRLTSDDYKKFDYIIAMDKHNIYNIKNIISSDPDHKICLLKNFIGLDEDILDPWYTREFDLCFDEINECVKKLYKLLLERM